MGELRHFGLVRSTEASCKKVTAATNIFDYLEEECTYRQEQHYDDPENPEEVKQLVDHDLEDAFKQFYETSCLNKSSCAIPLSEVTAGDYYSDSCQSTLNKRIYNSNSTTDA